jgi:hypothetical protein
MTCSILASTGLEFLPTLLLLLGAAGLLGVGIVLLSWRKIRSRRRLLVTCLLVLIGGSLAVTGAQGAMAATAGCADPPAASNTMTITQTSVLAGLAPGIAPTAITGVVTNNSTDSTNVTAIAVSIEAVTTRTGAVGVCVADDFVLIAPRMPVGQTLQGGGSATFGGASIGFNDTSVNQDACKSATVTLRYTTAG